MAVHRDTTSEVEVDAQFLKDVDEGLSATSKYLLSKYFYDEIGDDLFVQIMHLPEYYLTRAEHEIFKSKTAELIAALDLNPDISFDLIELGPGDGTKSIELLKELDAGGYSFRYIPIDISSNALKGLEAKCEAEVPGVNIEVQQGDYFDVLGVLERSAKPKVLLFMGSNIGNMRDEVASRFIYEVGANLHQGDKLLLGVDLIKPRDIVLPAYHDPGGVTAAFNLNILRRINVELGGNFDISKFRHAPEYEEEEGVMRSYLESLEEQEVFVDAMGKSFTFEKGELIHTEISRKYNDQILSQILEPTDFVITGRLTDAKGYFADYILEKR